ncbi:hypothetical protein HRR83_004832 [Exophiala dermatitidis]|uniref:Transcription factor Rba50 n=2 Tax=Exophiala dermatitidis TaxID=5970 RepID=H6C3U3_EXODN|nr:uncharacterized protein HMPREF1120_06320 [Exophiala dermatitidis NIH/UT8656]KAJ4514000.1 hypothetical protein HRR75_004581 [Exophiala dermatitidis]EHY58308.1 hypothetical protein HMPREF1120_06320 [Exophiala dermatitidis NIH/UT8656]KAJ4517251.1 hypothetical protein HRR74_005001 [Exophiala dermatitidis]KAJ4519570.1 hypothetical protein HRR73_003630 [Exophiala dermatitidis]KAJ4534633.1 hypothetical protein HRR76_006551 [Exophiala dermatitidis]
MAIPGQRFELDLDADDFTIRPLNDDLSPDLTASFAVKEIKEHDTDAPPPPPSIKSSRSGFPEHKPRRNVSAFKKNQAAAKGPARPAISSRVEPSDRAIAHHVAKKHGVGLDDQEKADISEENKRRIAEMSLEDIEEARAELMQSLNPAFLERLLKRANIDEDQSGQKTWPEDNQEEPEATVEPVKMDDASLPAGDDLDPATLNAGTSSGPSVHFPVPPRSTEEYVPLDANDPSFLQELKSHYFPDTPHDPSSLQWLQDPTEEENKESLYNPEKDSYLASALRFGFNGRLIPPRESLEIDVKQGLHHHGDDPNSAGYTIPELAMLARSTLPNQRCVAYQILGRMLFRLGRGDFGPRGSELEEALWSVIEKERPIEVMMSEANRLSGHVSAKAHAIEALWLWRKGGGGDRGVLKPGQRVAK